MAKKTLGLEKRAPRVSGPLGLLDDSKNYHAYVCLLYDVSGLIPVWLERVHENGLLVELVVFTVLYTNGAVGKGLTHSLLVMFHMHLPLYTLKYVPTVLIVGREKTNVH